MQTETILEDYVHALLAGNRKAAREIVRKSIARGMRARTIYKELLVPAMEQIQSLYRSDEISRLVEHLASRINRFITDQVQAQLIPEEVNGKTAIIICAEAEAEELGGQVCADVLEASGWRAFFLGGGVAEDELTEMIGSFRPDALVIYGSTTPGVPEIREMIERIRDIGAAPAMNVIVTGGIFDRVEGLWEEVQADCYSPDPVSVAETADQAPEKFHMPKDHSAPKRRRRLVGTGTN